MKSFLCVFLFVTFIITSCSDDKIVVSYYDSGALMEQYAINSDSIKSGFFVRFSENGDTLERSNYLNGKLDGTRVLYYDGNKPEIREKYVNDSLDGSYQVFYEDGQLKLLMHYRNNVLNDIVTKYYPSGAVLEEVTYENNKEEGPFIEYYENGQKKWEGTYTNGDNEIGLLVNFSETGDTIRKMMCDERSICRTIFENDKFKSSE